MKKELIKIAPLRVGVILGILYGFLALVFVPFLLLAMVFGGGRSGSPLGALFGGVAFLILMPVLYAAIGFVVGVVAAALYNLIVKWTGGLEFEVRDVQPVQPPIS